MALVDSVREFGGDVKIFSSLHVSGEQLDQLTGLCAVLRYSTARTGRLGYRGKKVHVAKKTDG